jgi:hypothetical protein
MNTPKIPEWILRDAVKDCTSVEEFARQYRKPYRFMGKGEDYVRAVMQTHYKEIELYGYTCISKHDSVTGKFECYVPNLDSLLAEKSQDTIKDSIQDCTEKIYSIH